MASQKIFSCTKCDAQSLKWLGQCQECGAWGTLVETNLAREPAASVAAAPVRVVSLGEHVAPTPKLASGIGEVDRVLGGGITPASLILLGGEPGVGKSTLCLQVARALAGEVLYFSGEESLDQVAGRWARIGGGNGMQFASSVNAEEIAATIAASNPPLAIVDSVQTISSGRAEGLPGSVGQVRAATAVLMDAAKRGRTAILLTGHVTKDGMVAGPKTLEHLVDVVLYLEGDRTGGYRLLRGVKNRFGSTDEVGVFVMNEGGLEEVANPSSLFLDASRTGESGQVVTVVMEGRRAFLAEVQVLCERAAFGYPQRKTSGFDAGRLQLLLAVMGKRLRLPLGTMDVFLNVIGGLRISEPAGDLAVCAALLSAAKDRAIGVDVALFGEVGLGGEVRKVGFAEQRRKEAERLGFKKIISADEVKHVRDLEAVLWG
ncbi:MAG: DNA repair protein RadA [bacterium]|nr:DNA repair protein RadA [bacterium]